MALTLERHPEGCFFAIPSPVRFRVRRAKRITRAAGEVIDERHSVRTS
jgi:hypothetical protein